ncbi:MAG: PKD domain-containing protein [Candidatus Thermoplasmatota archaeon]|nr:PKD domain-containing protein [Candidatus Thermoplasmatota archaeon]
MKRTKFLVVITLVGFFLFNICNGPILVWNYDTVSEGDVVSISSIEDENPSSSATRGNNWHTQIVDSKGIVGNYNSIALDTNNNPHISYYDFSNVYLKYSYYDGLLWHDLIADGQFGSGFYTSLALDSNNHPHISYFISGSNDLKYTYFDGVQWHYEIVDSQGDVGMWTSLALDSNNLPHISYFDSYNGDLKYAYSDGVQWYIETVDWQGDVGKYSSLALDSNDLPHISYYDVTNNDLKYAFSDGVHWINETVDSGGSVGTYCSIALDINNHPHISYYYNSQQNLKHAYFNGNFWDIWTVDFLGDVGRSTSIFLDINNNPHISHYEAIGGKGNVKYSYFNGVQWQSEIVAPSGNSSSTSIVLDTNDKPHISYYVGTTAYLKYAIIDNEPPILVEDETPNNGTTDDPFIFEITASDNNMVDSVNVSWNHGKFSKNIGFDNNGDGTWSCTIALDDSIGDLTYNIQVNDSAGNTYVNSLNIVTVYDNDNPMLESDDSLDKATTGDFFEFKITAYDNIQVASVYINWNHGDLENNISLKESGNFWVGTIILNQNSLDLFYTIHIKDSSNLYYRSSEKNVKVRDNDGPEFGTYWHSELKPGYPAYFSINITDNIAVEKVNFVIYTKNGEDSNLPVTNNTGTSWSIIIIPSTDARDIEYYFYALDIFNNWNQTNKLISNVRDIEPPKAHAGDDGVIDQYESFTFNGSLSIDNVGIENYTWTFVYNDTELEIYGKEVSFTFDMQGTYDVTLKVSDAAGSWNTDNLQVTVNFIRPLIANAGENKSAEIGTKIILNASLSSDKARITDYRWTLTYENKTRILTRMVDNFTFNNIGNYSIELTVIDIDGNTATDSIVVLITDLTLPTPFGSANRYETYEGGKVHFDATQSTDNDVIVNWTWKIKSTYGTFELYGEEVSHIFDKTGVYNVALVVRDAEGNEGYDENTSFNIVVDDNPFSDDEDSGKEMGISTWTMILIVIFIALVFGFINILIMKKRKRNIPTNTEGLDEEEIISKSEEDVDERGRVKPSMDLSVKLEEETDSDRGD